MRHIKILNILPRSTEEEKHYLKRRRPWYYLACGLLLLSILLRQPVILLTAIFTLLIAVIPELWFRYALRHLVIRQQVEEQHLFFGEEVILSLSIENRKWLPLPWLHIDNRITPPLTVINEHQARRRQFNFRTALSNTWRLWSYQRVTRRYHLPCYARGLHIFGPVHLSMNDPFGWIERELQIPIYASFLTYPLIIPINSPDMPALHPQGMQNGPRHLLEDPLWYIGNRQYERGDDPRRIDWKATARTGELQSKLYESTTMRRLLIVLDIWNYDETLKGPDLDLQEFTIAAAASLAIWGLDKGYEVGLLCNSAVMRIPKPLASIIESNSLHTLEKETHSLHEVTEISPPEIRIPFAQGDEQYQILLTQLACLMPTSHTPIEYLIETEEDLFQPGTTILLVSVAETVNQETLDLLQERKRQNRVILALTNATRYQYRRATVFQDFEVYYLGGKEKWHELVRSSRETTANASKQGKMVPLTLG